jgi:hypothetical protein
MPTYADPIQFPLSAPTVSTTTYTVDFLLQNPTRVTRIVNDLTLSNFFLDDIFAIGGGGVDAGVVLYDQATTLDSYTDRDVERIEPGAEAPIVGGVRTAPLVAQVEKFGGKFVMTAEAIRRNDQSRMRNQMRRLANTITRKMHQRGLAEIAANITTFSRTATGVSWSDALALTMTTAAANNMPGAVGEMRLEEPLRTVTVDESRSAPTLIEQTWVQSLVNPVMFVTDPYAILEVTALEA